VAFDVENSMTAGQRLRALREAAGLSRAQVARAIGWSDRGTVVDYELNRRSLTASAEAKIVAAIKALQAAKP